MQRRELTFRVFVSSTFSDLKTERSALQENAFPRLHAYRWQKGNLNKPLKFNPFIVDDRARY